METRSSSSLHNANGQCTSDAIDFFAANGDLTMVRGLVQIGRRDFPQTMDMAAASGHLEVVQFLHDFGATCTTEAMNGAATNGHLGVLKWLHENRTEGITEDAMDEAANHGHFNVVAWLHEQHAPCTEYAMDAAAGQGRFGILDFLHRNRDEGCSHRASVWAADYGRVEILQWVRSNYPYNYDVPATVRAAPTHGWDEELVQDLCGF